MLRYTSRVLGLRMVAVKNSVKRQAMRSPAATREGRKRLRHGDNGGGNDGGLRGHRRHIPSSPDWRCIMSFMLHSWKEGSKVHYHHENTAENCDLLRQAFQ